MAEETKGKAKEEVKKLDDVKDTEEKKAIVDPEVKAEKEESKPAVAKEKKSKKSESKVELEREYVVPLKKGVLNVPHYRRAKKAVRVLKEFMVRHMGVRDRDLNKVKVDINLNNEIWFRGIKKPMNKIKVKAKKIDGIVHVELAEIPEVIRYKIAREEKRKAAASSAKVKVPKKVKEEKTEEEKTEEKEDAKAGAEAGAKMEKSAAKNVQHSTKGSHAQKTMPVRKVLK
jgi:ribosomal protein L31E